MRKFLTWILLHTFLMFIVFPRQMPLYAQQKSRTTIAVLSFESRGGVSENEAATLADRLSTELVRLGIYTVVERARMQEILQEQGFNMTGCTGSECAVEAGRLLGVQQMVTGNIGKIGNILAIDIRVFDVGSGQIIKAHQFNHKGDISGLLSIMKKVAEEITIGKVSEEKKFPWLWVSLGTVVVAGGAVLLFAVGGDTKSDGTDKSLPDPAWPPE